MRIRDFAQQSTVLLPALAGLGMYSVVSMDAEIYRSLFGSFLVGNRIWSYGYRNHARQIWFGRRCFSSL